MCLKRARRAIALISALYRINDLLCDPPSFGRACPAPGASRAATRRTLLRGGCLRPKRARAQGAFKPELCRKDTCRAPTAERASIARPLEPTFPRWQAAPAPTETQTAQFPLPLGRQLCSRARPHARNLGDGVAGPALPRTRGVDRATNHMRQLRNASSRSQGAAPHRARPPAPQPWLPRTCTLATPARMLLRGAVQAGVRLKPEDLQQRLRRKMRQRDRHCRGHLYSSHVHAWVTWALARCGVAADAGDARREEASPRRAS